MPCSARYKEYNIHGMTYKNHNRVPNFMQSDSLQKKLYEVDSRGLGLKGLDTVPRVLLAHDKIEAI